MLKLRRAFRVVTNRLLAKLLAYYTLTVLSNFLCTKETKERTSKASSSDIDHIILEIFHNRPKVVYTFLFDKFRKFMVEIAGFTWL